MFKKGLFLFVLFLPTGLFAQDSLDYIDTLKRVDINRLKISTTEQAPMPSQVLRPVDWADINSTTVADAVKYFSGVQVRDYGGVGGLKTIDVRNLGANHTTILYDGVAINNAQNGQVDLGKFSLDNIESLSLYQGQPNSLLLPAKAFSAASALLLEPLVPHFKDGKRTNIKFGMKTGSFGLVNPSLLWEQKLTSQSSLSFSSEYTKAHGEYDFYFRRGIVDTLVRRENSDIEGLRLQLGLNGVLPDSSLWNIRLYHYAADRGLPGAAVDNRFFSEERQEDRDYFIQGKWEKQVSSRYQLLVNAKHQYAYLHYSDPNFLTSEGHLENVFKQHESYLSLANLLTLSSQLQASVSADYIHQTLDANLRDFAYPTRNTFLLNAAAQWKWKRLQMNVNALATLWNEKTEIREEVTNTQDIGNSISASWQPLLDHNLYVRAFHKSIFRAPTFNDMYYTLVGSTSLKPEYVNQYNVGLTWQKALRGPLEYFEFKIDAYQNAIKDRITAIPLNSLFRWSMVNLGQVDISGIDAALSGRIKMGAASLDAGINYTYQEAIDKTPDGTTYNQFIPYTPKHSGAFFATANYDRLSLSYNALYVGERYSLRPNTMENLMADWLIHNVAASYELPIAKQVYCIQAELNNLTNHHYQVIRSYPMPGMHYRLALQITF